MRTAKTEAAMKDTINKNCDGWWVKLISRLNPTSNEQSTKLFDCKFNYTNYIAIATN